MTKNDLIKKIIKRKKELGITIENLAKLSNLGIRTLNRFLAGDDVKLSTVEKVTTFLGLDFAGNEVISLEELQQKRAKEKALFMASLVQSTSALEMQGLDNPALEKIINQFEEEFLYGKHNNKLWVV